MQDAQQNDGQTHLIKRFDFNLCKQNEDITIVDLNKRNIERTLHGIMKIAI